MGSTPTNFNISSSLDSLNNTPQELENPSASTLLHEEGKLEGAKIISVEPSSLPKNHSSSSLASTASLSSSSSSSSSQQGKALHSFAQVSSSSLTVADADRMSDSSPSVHTDHQQNPSRIEQKRLLLEEKIKGAEEPIASLSAGFVQQQKNYISTLRKILKSLEDLSFDEEKNLEESTIENIETAVNEMVGLADMIHSYVNKTITFKLKHQKEMPYDSRCGEAREAIGHYNDCIQALRKGDYQSASKDFSLAKRSFIKFKLTEARANKNQSLIKLYEKANDIYDTIVDQNLFNDERGSLLKKAGNLFGYAGRTLENKLPVVAEAYQKAGDLFISAISEKDKGRLQQAEVLLETGEAVKQLATKLFVAIKQSVGPEIESLNNAVTYYEEAAIQFQKGHLKLSALNLQAAQYSEKAFNKRENQKVFHSLMSASMYYRDAILELQKGNEEISELYKKIGEACIKIVDAQHPQIAKEWNYVGSAYMKIIEKKQQGLKETDPATQLYKLTAQYGQIAAEDSGERDSGENQEVLIALDNAMIAFTQAGVVLEQKDKELSEAYEKYAISCLYLAIALKPELREKFPPSVQSQFKKEAVRNQSLINYWKDAVEGNTKKLQEIQKKINSKKRLIEQEEGSHKKSHVGKSSSEEEEMTI